MTTARQEARIKQRYVSPPHPTAFGGLHNLAQHWNIAPGRARTILADIDAYNLHRSYRKPKTRNPFYVYTRRDMIQLDAIEVSSLAKHNRGVNHLLLAIDCYSRFVWVRTLKSKRAEEVVAAMDSIFTEMGTLPRRILSDRGSELKNRRMIAFLQGRGVKLVHPNSEIKAALAERANRSVQDLIYRSMTDRQSRSYVDQLPAIVETYNHRSHRSIGGLSPHEAELAENDAHVVSALREHYAEAIQPARTLPFKVGDLVRVKTGHGQRFARGYDEQFTGEIFKVERINKRMAVPMYILRSEDDLELLDGGFYSNELSLVGKNMPFKVERVLRERMRGGVKWYLVRWMYFGPQHDSWIKATDVARDYRGGNAGRT
jgi:transposase InsO family protein